MGDVLEFVNLFTEVLSQRLRNNIIPISPSIFIQIIEAPCSKLRV
jgi:hypothetical protein